MSSMHKSLECGKLMMNWTFKFLVRNEWFTRYNNSKHSIAYFMHIFARFIISTTFSWKKTLTRWTYYLHMYISYTFLSNWNCFKRFHCLCLCNEEWKIKSFYINVLIFHSSLHKQSLWNLSKRFQFDKKV